MSTTTPESGPGSGTRPPGIGDGVLRRADDERILTGVCGGLARHAGIDPVLVRVGFAVLVLGSGIGFFLYIAAFLLMRNGDGSPGYVEQWTNRRFDAQTVLALLTAVLGFGLVMNLFADTTGPGTVVVGTMTAIALLAARSRGVDVLGFARSLPDLLSPRRTAPGRTDDAHPSPEPGYGPPYQEAAATGAPAAGEASPAVSPAAPATAGADPADRTDTKDRTDTEDRTDAEDRTDTPPPPGATDQTVVLPHIPQPRNVRTDPPGGTGDDGYRRLSDLARQARSAYDAYDAHAPFAPHGPYHPPAEPGYGHPGPDLGHSPYGPSPYATPAPATTAKRRHSFVGPVTIVLAILVGGIMAATQPSTSSLGLPLIGGAMLVTIGAGLLVTAWFGRGIGLIAAGTLVSLILIAGITLDGIPKQIGSYTWAPTTVAEARSEHYRIGIGDGRLDLSELKAAPGSRTRLEVSIAVGTLEVIVPPTARVEVNARVRIGDITVGRVTRSGNGLSLTTTLEPRADAGSQPPVLELHIKGGMGDVEVRRGRA